MTRDDIQLLIDAIADGVPNTALKVRTVLEAIADGTGVSGDVKEIDVSTAYIASNFDVTGLGTNERLGWAICNGNNGTRNRSGRVPVAYSVSDVTFSTLGATGGEKTHTLTINEMPIHSHVLPSDFDDSSDMQSLVSSRNSDEGFGDANQKTATSGGGLAHNIMQPYIVTLFIQKL